MGDLAEGAGGSIRHILFFIISVAAISVAALSSPLAAQDEGRPLAVRSLEFDGNRALDDFSLRISIETSQSGWLARWWPIRWIGLGRREFLDETEFQRDVLRLQVLYQASGYREATVDTVVTRAADHVRIRFVINEGDPIIVDSLSLVGTEGVIAPTALTRDLPLRQGDPFELLRLALSSDSIRLAMQNHGYPFARVFVNFSIEYASRSAVLEFVVDPGIRSRVGRVDVVGPSELDESLVRNVLRISPGDVYSQEALYRGQQELYRLGVFDFVDVRLADASPLGSEDSLVTLVAQVSQGRLHRLRFGGGYGTNDCLRLLSSWTVRNFLGGGRSLDLSASASKLGTGSPFSAGFQNNLCPALARETEPERLNLNYNLTTTLRFPTVFSTRRSASVSVSAERFSEFQAFLRTALGFNVSVTQQTRFDVPITFSYSLSYGSTKADEAVFCSLLNVCSPGEGRTLESERIKATVGVSVARDRSNSPLNPTRGSVFSIDGRLASSFTGSDADIRFAKGVAEFASYHPVGRRSVFAWRLRFGSIRTPDLSFQRQEKNKIPIEERFYGGGPATVRGFRQNELGPLVYVSVTDDLTGAANTADSGVTIDTVTELLASPTGGNQVLFANAEYRFPLSGGGRLGGVVFVDVGRVFARGDSLVVNPGIRVTPGIGLRFSTPLGPVRLDLAYNPHGPEEGPLFEQTCTTPEGGDRICQTPVGTGLSIARPLGNGIFGLGKVGGFEFVKRLRLNLSIGQAF